MGRITKYPVEFYLAPFLTEAIEASQCYFFWKLVDETQMVKPPVYHNSKKIFGPSKLSFHYETPCNRMLRALRIMEWISLYQFRIFFTLSIKRKKLYLHSHNLSNLFLRGTPATFIPFLILKMSWATNFDAWYLQNYIFFTRIIDFW